MPHIHPALQILIDCAFMAWPLAWLYRRVGLSPWWSVLIFFSLLVPFLGMALVTAPLALKKWPNFPTVPKPPGPIKKPI